MSVETPHRAKRGGLLANIGHTPKHLTPKTQPSAALSADLSNVQRVLTEIQNKPTRVPDELDVVNAASANIQNNLDSETEHFGKLKLILIELETKNCFLEHLQNLNGNFDDKVLEATFQAEKEKIRVLKKTNASLYKRIQEICNEVGEHYEPSQKELVEANELLGRTIQLRDDVRQLKRQTHQPLYVNDEQMTMDNAQLILDQQKQTIVELLENEQTCKSEIADLQWQISQVGDVKENLKAQASEIQSQIKSIDIQETDGVSVKSLSEKKEWYENMLDLMRKMSHNKMRMEDNKLHVDISSINPLTQDLTLYTLTIELDDELNHIVIASLAPAGRVDISIIVQEATYMNDIVFLIREVKHRIKFITTIMAEVERLSELYGVEWHPKTQRISVPVKEGRIITLYVQDAVVGKGYSVHVSGIRPGIGMDIAAVIASYQKQLDDNNISKDLGGCIRLLCR
eukprot:CFRG8221T1